MAAVWIAFFVLVLVVLSYQRASVAVWTVGIAVYLLLISFLSALPVFIVTLYWIIFAAITFFLNVRPVRRRFFTVIIFSIYKKLMPRMSDTEREALNAGDVDWSKNIFGGMIDWNQFKHMPHIQLTEEEQAFIDGPTEKLCSMVHDWSFSRSMNIPEPVWDHLKEHKFFALFIPKNYGGMQFSAAAVSQIITKVASSSSALASVVTVPNSLGPGELLQHYGTQAQKDYYLPRLASGDDLPCFGLTSPVAGSDAGSIVDNGVVCEAEFEGKLQLCIRLNWNKRYITLAPVATLIGLAFKLYDPDHLLGDKRDIGITLALIPRTTAGVSIGRHHYPLDSCFPNGPIQGKDVIIPFNWVIGDRPMVGCGWRMLMECLAAGRGISLPSVAAGGASKAALASGAYARIRRQFNTHVGAFGGVEEVLTRICGYSYLVKALTLFTVSMVDQGIKPVVGSAVSKYNTTEYTRKIITDSMDVHGGKGICMGPNNYLAQGYIELPIAITVEGANILTRSMITFGQGAIRSHPYFLTEMLAASEDNKKKGLTDFDKALFAHVGFLLSNKCRTFILGVTNARFTRVPSGPLRRYYQLFNRYTAAFSFIADTSMLLIGADLKRLEKLSGRLADLLSCLYMIASVLKFFDSDVGSHGDRSDEIAVAKWICQHLFYQFQIALNEFIGNFPRKWLASPLRWLVFPLGLRLLPPTDKLGAQVAKSLQQPSRLRDVFAKNIYITANENNPVGVMHELLADIIAAEPIEKKVIKAERSGDIFGKNFDELVAAAVQAQILSKTEAEQLHSMNAARMNIINVDDFAKEEIIK